MASYIERRKFLATLGSAAAWPVAGRAQPSSVRPLISILSPLTAAAASRNIAAFRSALRDLGYVEGRNLTLAFHYGDGSAERMPSLARELVASFNQFERI
jgi:putative tryptophan/tyrosine transport system substrate-binding protein